VVFNTSMTGYQEILTDPSYKGQIVTMTYPLMGNYGVNFEDLESRGVQVEGFIVREYHPYPSNWRAQGDLATYLKANGKLAVEGLDTRAITKRLREVGAMRGIISTQDLDPASLVRRARELPSMEGQDLVPLVTCREPYWWDESFGGGGQGPPAHLQSSPKPSPPTPYRGLGGRLEGRAGDHRQDACGYRPLGPPLKPTLKLFTSGASRRFRRAGRFGGGAGLLEFLGQDVEVVPELPDGLALHDYFVDAVKGGGEHPQKKAEQDDDPEVNVRAFQ
jgi:hypothetical protein